MSQPAAADEEPALPWEEAEAMTEAALRQHDTVAGMNEGYDSRWDFIEQFIRSLYPTQLDAQAVFSAGRRVTPGIVQVTVDILMHVRVPFHPQMVNYHVQRLFHRAAHDHNNGNYTEYVRARIPMPLLRAAAMDQVHPGGFPNDVQTHHTLRAGFADRFALQQSNATAFFAQLQGSAVANLIGQFLSGRIDGTLLGHVPQRPLIPPAPAAAAAAAPTNRRRGANDDHLAGHKAKKSRPDGSN